MQGGADWVDFASTGHGVLGGRVDVKTSATPTTFSVLSSSFTLSARSGDQLTIKADKIQTGETAFGLSLSRQADSA